MANNITLTGRLTENPQIKTTQNGVSVCSFTLAVKRPHVKDTTDFIPCQVWRQGAEYLSKYGAKGNMVAATGSLITRKWQDQSGNNRISYDVLCDSVELLSSNSNGGANNNTANAANAQHNSSAPVTAYGLNPSPQFEDLGDEELPF